MTFTDEQLQAAFAAGSQPASPKWSDDELVKAWHQYAQPHLDPAFAASVRARAGEIQGRIAGEQAGAKAFQSTPTIPFTKATGLLPEGGVKDIAGGFAGGLEQMTTPRSLGTMATAALA